MPMHFKAVDGNRDGNPERRPRTTGANGRVHPAVRFTVRYTRRVATSEWEIYLVDEVRDWIDSLDPVAHARVVQALDLLAETGPGLGRPLVDTIHGSTIANLKELRPGTVRILFAFDPWRCSILLVAGDKAGRWNQWYTEAIPLAEQRYETYLKERTEEEGGTP
jgi:hypothetical protein